MLTKMEKLEKRRKAKLARQKALKKKRKLIKYEDNILTKANLQKWEIYRENYNIFRGDCLIPRARNHWTTYKKIWNVYEQYCKALGQLPAIPRKCLGLLLTENFVRRSAYGETQYGLVVRPDLFVKVDDTEVTDQYVDTP